MIKKLFVLIIGVMLTANSFVGDGSGLTGITAIDELLGFYTNSHERVYTGSTTGNEGESCDDGDYAVGGGADPHGASPDFQVYASFPASDNAWGFTYTTSPGTWTFKVVCADYAPAHSNQGPIIIIP